MAANIKATGTTGGTVNITGYNILLDSPTTIDVSGTNGGGMINVGGNFQGKGPLPNANAVVMAPGASLHADATTMGNGGQIVLWSQVLTRGYGIITAKGGSQGGNGGLVETSSHGLLDINGILVATNADHGTSGTWLLDPANVTISVGADSSYTNLANTFTPDSGAASSNINIGTLTGASGLLNNDIIIQTTNAGVSGGALGNITVVDPITWTSTHALSLLADNNIIINAGISGCEMDR